MPKPLTLTMITLLSTLCILASTVWPAAKADAGPSSAHAAPALTLAPIAFKLRDGATIAAEQGAFEVPEQRRNRASRKITIRFIRFKSTSPHPGPPIVYLAGGPGGSGVDAARGPRQPIFLALRAVGDVIALDQRGTGESNPIAPCTAAKPLDPAAGLNQANLTAYYRSTLTTCIATWRSAGVAVAGYTTLESADDLADLGKVLGAPKLQL